MKNLNQKMAENGTMRAKDFALLYENIIPIDGIINGCNMEIINNYQLHISHGFLLLHGRIVEVPEKIMNLTLCRQNYIYGFIYASIENDRCEIYSCVDNNASIQAALDPSMIRYENRYDNIEYVVPLATYDADYNKCSNLKIVCSYVNGKTSTVGDNMDRCKTQGYAIDSLLKKNQYTFKEDYVIKPDSWEYKNGEYNVRIPDGFVLNEFGNATTYRHIIVIFGADKGNEMLALYADNRYIYSRLKPTRQIIIPVILYIERKGR